MKVRLQLTIEKKNEKRLEELINNFYKKEYIELSKSDFIDRLIKKEYQEIFNK